MAAAVAPDVGGSGRQDSDAGKGPMSLMSWPKPPPLEGVKSKKRAILELQKLGPEGEQDVASLSLASRVALHGLSAEEAGDLLRTLSGMAAEGDAKAAPWRWTRHDALRVLVLSPTHEDPPSAVAAEMPHVIVVPASSIELSRAACEALATYPGALLIIAEEGVKGLDESLAALGVSERWASTTPRLVDDILVNEPLSLTLPEEEHKDPSQGPTFLHDVRLRAPSSPQHYCKPWLADMLEEQFAPLYMEEFGADMGNLRQSQRGYGIKLSLMVDESAAEPELLGFLACKSWGAPMPGVSVCAVGVPSKFRGCGYGRRLMEVAESEAAHAGDEALPGSVRFRSLATAVGFYTRLGYQRMDEDAEEGEEPAPASSADDSDEDAPCVPMERVCARTGAETPPGGRSPLQSWSTLIMVLVTMVIVMIVINSNSNSNSTSTSNGNSNNSNSKRSPRRARHLEDGPTWLPVEAFDLPEAEAVA